MSAGEKHELHLVCGPPACGKTTFGRALATRLQAAFLDSDQVTERVVRAGLEGAGMPPDDRDSPAYKARFREAVYQTLYDLADENLPRVPVVVAGPFTSECREEGWLDWLRARFGTEVTVHFVWCEPAARRVRMEARGEPRDLAKLAHWEEYLRTTARERPPFPHHWVEDGEQQEV